MSNKIAEVEATDNLEVPYDTSDPKQVNTARKKAAKTRADRLQFVEAAMNTEQGRAWYYDILKRCHVFNVPYVDGDPYATAFKCGETNIGIQILDDIQTIASGNYVKMVDENKRRNE